MPRIKTLPVFAKGLKCLSWGAPSTLSWAAYHSALVFTSFFWRASELAGCWELRAFSGLSWASALFWVWMCVLPDSQQHARALRNSITPHSPDNPLKVLVCLLFAFLLPQTTKILAYKWLLQLGGGECVHCTMRQDKGQDRLCGGLSTLFHNHKIRQTSAITLLLSQ